MSLEVKTPKVVIHRTEDLQMYVTDTRYLTDHGKMFCCLMLPYLAYSQITKHLLSVYFSYTFMIFPTDEFSN